ncbi:MAG TPA: alpha/beta hydrolase [Candidatus Acidoferrales bacterium]|nr:alpha/beta hydrolase [Candidatus Acidoferrales bacterium]
MMALSRGRFFLNAAMTVAAAELAALGTAEAKNTSFPSIKQVNAGVLDIGYADLGPPTGTPVILLHGWPYDIHSYVDVAPILAAAGYRVIVPFLRGYGSTTFLSKDTFRNAQEAAVALDVIDLMDALHIKKAVVGGFDWGARTVGILGAIWPERCKAVVSVSGYLITDLPANLKPLPPAGEYAWWYQYYFSTERGVLGYTQYRHDFNKLIWQIVSPKWKFDDATFDRTAQAFENPDHVAIVIHDYRWRLSLAKGEHKYDAIQKKLAAKPDIGVPAITIASDFDGAGASGAAYRSKFTGKYEHRIFKGIGHNVPQEAPQPFAQAIIDADKMA